MDDEVQALVAEQIAYYRAHAPDYDVAYLGQDWDSCIEELPVAGDVLELACGTGHWTPLLAARARSVTALDAAPKALAVARRRVRGLPVEFLQTDVFTWQPSRRFNTVFFGFWLTHVPPGPVRRLLVHGRQGPSPGRVGLLRRRPRPGTYQRAIRHRPGNPGGLAPASRRQRAPGGQGLLHAGSADGQAGRAGLVGRHPRDQPTTARRHRAQAVTDPAAPCLPN